MVQKKTFKSPLNSFQRLSVRKDGKKILFWELLLFALIMTLSSCGAGGGGGSSSPSAEAPGQVQLSPEEIQRREEEAAKKRQAEAEEAERLRVEIEKKRQELETERKAQIEREKAEEAQRYEELKKAPLKFSRTPETSRYRSPREVSKSELRKEAKNTSSYYVKGRKKSKGLLDIRDAQVVFVGNMHMLPDAQSIVEKTASNTVKGMLDRSAESRMKDMKEISEVGGFTDNVLLVEGASYGSQVSSTELEDFRIVEKELAKNFNISNVRGWDNAYANVYGANIIKALQTQSNSYSPYSYYSRRDQNIIELYILQISFDFIVVQLRNYFLYQSVIRALEENPKARIFVTAGTCHTACDESIFSLLDATNIRYATYESKESVEMIAEREDPKEILLDQLDSYRYDKSKIPAIAKKVRATQLDGFIEISAKFQDKRSLSSLEKKDADIISQSLDEIVALKAHLKQFFRQEAYID